MPANKITTPMSSTGILRFYDTTTGGPLLDPRAVIIASVIFIVFIKLMSFIIPK